MDLESSLDFCLKFVKWACIIVYSLIAILFPFLIIIALLTGGDISWTTSGFSAVIEEFTGSTSIFSIFFFLIINTVGIALGNKSFVGIGQSYIFSFNTILQILATILISYAIKLLVTIFLHFAENKEGKLYKLFYSLVTVVLILITDLALGRISAYSFAPFVFILLCIISIIILYIVYCVDKKSGADVSGVFGTIISGIIGGFINVVTTSWGVFFTIMLIRALMSIANFGITGLVYSLISVVSCFAGLVLIINLYDERNHIGKKLLYLLFTLILTILILSI